MTREELLAAFDVATIYHPGDHEAKAALVQSAEMLPVTSNWSGQVR